MQDLREEINHAIAQMQADICDDAHEELRKHLSELLCMIRNELQCVLMEESWGKASKCIDSIEKPASAIVEPYKNVSIDGDEIKQPLTVDELKAGGWWCADVSEECGLAFAKKGFNARYDDWSSENEYKYCYLAGDAIVRSSVQVCSLTPKQIHRIGNEFYWGEE